MCKESVDFSKLVSQIALGDRNVGFFPSLDSSIFFSGFKVQWQTLSRRFANVEIKVRLFAAFGVLLSPQYQQKRRKFGKDDLRSMDLRVTPRTESDHQMQNRLARFPMMDSGIRITAHPTGVSIAF